MKKKITGGDGPFILTWTRSQKILHHASTRTPSGESCIACYIPGILCSERNRAPKKAISFTEC